MSTGRLVILGSSAGLASAHRASSSYLLDSGDRGILMDCGDGATRNLLAASYRPDWIDRVIITHTHADHVCGLPYYLQQRYLTGTQSPLTIHCPAEAVEMLKRIFAFGYMFPERLPFEVRFEEIHPGVPWDSDCIRWTGHPTSHLEANSRLVSQRGYPNRCECFALRVELGGTTLVYSADLGSLRDLDVIPGPIDWLLVETSHVALDQLWPWAESKGIRRIVLTHLSDDFDPAGVSIAAKHTSAVVTIAADGMVFDLALRTR